MAEKETYPRFPEKSWWALREQFKKSMPTSVTPKYIATVLSPMDERSAKNNLYPYLIMLKIIDSNGKPTQRAINWRDDTLYGSVCDEVVAEIYPKELTEACIGPEPDREAVQRWFAKTLGVGNDAASRMAGFYILLITKRIGAQVKVNNSTNKTSRPKSVKQRMKPEVEKEPKEKLNEVTPIEVPNQKTTSKATIHIDLQIHISPDSTPELIDKIFESIKKHLYVGEE